MADSCVGEGFSEELTCPLCLDSWKDPVEMVPCEHIFCKGCAKILKNCPVCRRSIEGQRAPNRTLVNMALQVRVKCRVCCWTGKREESLNHKCGPPSQNPSNYGSAAASFSEGSTPQVWQDHLMVPQQGTSNWGGFGAPGFPPPSTQQGPHRFSGGAPMYAAPPPQPSSGFYSQPPHGGGRVPQRRYQTIVPTGNRPWMLYGIDQQEYDQIVSLFIFFDDDDSGQLDKGEVSRLAHWLNFARTPQEVDRIFADMDSNGSGSLSLAEFLTWLKYNKPNPEALYGLTQSQYNTIMMQFHTHDSNHDGALDESEFCRLVLHLGDVRDPQGARELFRQIDTNGDRSIDLHEFLRFRSGRR